MGKGRHPARSEGRGGRDGGGHGASARDAPWIQVGCGSIWPRSRRACRACGYFFEGPAQPVRVEKPLQHQFQEGFELDVGHRKARQGPVGGVAQFEPGPGQGREHGVDVEVVAGLGAGLAGGQSQVLLGVAEIELDLLGKC